MNIKTVEELGPLPVEHIKEYDYIAKRCATQRRIGTRSDFNPPDDHYSTPGAIDWILADPESFQERVKEFEYELVNIREKQ